ncbi:MAG: MATE family efflux transporter [Butyricicoccus sp.]
MQKDLTKGNMLSILLQFSLPYLLSCFLQTFYGLADLFVIGQFNGAASTTAVSVGSQIMHMVTVIIIGLAMGSTVTISRALGARRPEQASKTIGNTVVLFLVVSLAATGLLIAATDGILRLLSTPSEAFAQTHSYLLVCFAGVPFITAYNVISCVFRGLGDSKTPMYFVALAGVINLALDVVLIGPLHMAATGAALATVISQTISVLAALVVLRRRPLGVTVHRADFRPSSRMMRSILGIGIPIAVQDGFVQVSFLVITAIANQRGVVAAASVGIVEKIISFLFLVPSAMLSSVSAIGAQNAGARLHDRSRLALRYAITVTTVFGLIVGVLCQFFSPQLLSLFTGDSDVVFMGAQYLRGYVWDCTFAGFHFCFSGYFCAYGRSYLSFLHNCISILVARIPGALLTSMLFPQTLFPMGLAIAGGSALSTLICVVIYVLRSPHWCSEGETAAAE